MSLSPDERALVARARREGLLPPECTIAYLPGWPCLALGIALVPLTLGASLVLTPMVWVAQHESTARRLEHLRRRMAHPPGGPASPAPIRGAGAGGAS